jgi:hypothetical protein
MSDLLDKLFATAPTPSEPRELISPPGVRPLDWQVAAERPTHPTRGWGRAPVSGSEDLDRVLAIPRRPPVDLNGPTGEALVELMTARLRRPERPCKCKSEHGRQCILRLKASQAWALYEAPLAGGLAGLIAVGAGKTGLDIMMPMVMPGCRLAVLLVPPGLVPQLEAEYLLWREHWRVPSLVSAKRSFIVNGAPTLHVLPFSKLSRPDSTALLNALAPDLIIMDEAHKARHADTATTSRILRYFGEHPNTRLCFWTGSLTTDSIINFTHLMALGLRGDSPTPLDPCVAKEWASAIDPSDWPAAAGALERLCTPGEHVRQGFCRRLKDTQGVVATVDSSCDAPLTLSERPAPAIPDELAGMIRGVQTLNTRPDGEELLEIIEVAACVDQLINGFFYRWRFPDIRGVPQDHDTIDDWFAARKEFMRELREKLKARAEHLDSPHNLVKAAIRYHQGHPPPVGLGRPYDGPLPAWDSYAWPRWARIMRSVVHETETIWVDEYLIEDAAAWAQEHCGVVWYEHNAFGRRLGERTGLPVFGGGPDAKAALRNERGTRSIICSINAHGTGTDGLQHHFTDQLVVNPPGTAQLWEQLLGRLHRQGQEKEVRTWVYRHVVELRETLDKAFRQAEYVLESTQNAQKLLLADRDF